MVDIENKIRGIVLTAIRAEYPSFRLLDDYPEVSDKFPCGTLEMADNYTYTRTQDSSSGENHVSVLFEVNIYSNSKRGKKEEAKTIAQIADRVLLDNNFTRTFYGLVPNIDRSIARCTMRYTAIVSAPKEADGELIYTIYRR